MRYCGVGLLWPNGSEGRYRPADHLEIIVSEGRDQDLHRIARGRTHTSQHMYYTNSMIRTKYVVIDWFGFSQEANQRRHGFLGIGPQQPQGVDRGDSHAFLSVLEGVSKGGNHRWRSHPDLTQGFG